MLGWGKTASTDCGLEECAGLAMQALCNMGNRKVLVAHIKGSRAHEQSIMEDNTYFSEVKARLCNV